MEAIQKGLQTVINKAWDDAQFKSELVANPKSAIQTVTGLAVPEGVNIVVNDQTDPDTIFLNIPSKPNFESMELTDEQLEQVSGGEVFVIVGTAISIFGSAAATIAVSVNDNNKQGGGKHW